MMNILNPIFPWCGSKRRQSEIISSCINKSLNDSKIYYEPFIGGGAIFLKLQPKSSIISDINPEIINFWKCMKKDHSQILNILHKHEITKIYYDKINESFKDKIGIERAAHFIILISCCFMNMYKIHPTSGKFISGFDHSNTTPNRFKRPGFVTNFNAVGEFLKKSKVKIIKCNYQISIKDVINSVIYFDPPYSVKSKLLPITYNILDSFDNDEFISIIKRIRSKNDIFISNANYTEFMDKLKQSSINFIKIKLPSKTNACPNAFDVNRSTYRKDIFLKII